jgi:cyclic dehypoxanthinyl futalosine synthase
MPLPETIAHDALVSDDLIGLGMEADALRRSLHPGPAATYVVSANALAYTSGDINPSLGGTAEFPVQPEAVLDHGGCDLILDGPPTLSQAESTLRGLAEHYPALSLHGFSAEDILRWSDSSHPVAVSSTLARLKEAGLQSLGAGGALILDDSIRARFGLSTSIEWLGVHSAAHQIGIPSFAALAIGLGESPQARIAHLAALRETERDTPGFVGFTLSVHHDVQSRREEEATAADYLKTLATARLQLENIAHIQADWSVQGPKILELALRFGADDAGSVLPRHNAPTPAHHAGEGELRRILRDAGFRPTSRDLLFRRCFLA